MGCITDTPEGIQITNWHQYQDDYTKKGLARRLTAVAATVDESPLFKDGE
jgi:hypothetical protein